MMRSIRSGYSRVWARQTRKGEKKVKSNNLWSDKIFSRAKKAVHRAWEICNRPSKYWLLKAARKIQCFPSSSRFPYSGMLFKCIDPVSKKTARRVCVVNVKWGKNEKLIQWILKFLHFLTSKEEKKLEKVFSFFLLVLYTTHSFILWLNFANRIPNERKKLKYQMRGWRMREEENFSLKKGSEMFLSSQRSLHKLWKKFFFLSFSDS